MGPDIPSPRDCDSRRFSPLLQISDNNVERQHRPLKEKVTKTSNRILNERFLRGARSKERWWSRLIDGEEPVCPLAGTFVMMVRALATWPIYTQWQLQLWSSLLTTGIVNGYKSPRWLRLQLSATLFLFGTGGTGWSPPCSTWSDTTPVPVPSVSSVPRQFHFGQLYSNCKL